MGQLRPRLTTEQLRLLWSHWQRGETAVQLSDRLGCHKSTITWVVGRAGGLAPRVPTRARWALRAEEREEISRGLAQGEGMRSLARRLGRAPSTLSREIHRHGGAALYRAATADAAAWRRAQRPQRGRLATSGRLRRVVTAWLERHWSPEQIARQLRRRYPDDPEMHVSHETIYRALYVQARGALKRELVAHLRRGQRYRRPRAQARSTRGPGQLVDIVTLAERPPSADTRAIPGHWEGDLLLGKQGTQIITLVERHSRYVLLIRSPAADSATVVDAVARRITRLPAALQQSLTWDRGKEMAQHRRFTVDTGVQVYFCDPQRPWQRGSNENTNGLLRQYYPKGTDLSRVTQRQLDAVALRLNTRPRLTLGDQTPAEVLAATVAMTG
jgi:IS30 family transposase